MKMSVLKLRGQMWKVIIHGPPETIFEGKNQAFIVQFPQGYPFDPPMIYTADEDIRLPFLLGGNIAPFKILRYKIITVLSSIFLTVRIGSPPARFPFPSQPYTTISSSMEKLKAKTIPQPARKHHF